MRIVDIISRLEVQGSEKLVFQKKEKVDGSLAER